MISFFDKLIENVKYVSVISALLGGGLQVFYLSSMSIGFLRFFSVSQMLADTLVLFAALSLLSAFVYLIKWRISNFHHGEIVAAASGGFVSLLILGHLFEFSLLDLITKGFTNPTYFTETFTAIIISGLIILIISLPFSKNILSLLLKIFSNKNFFSWPLWGF